MVHQLFIVLILYDNRVMSSEPFDSLTSAKNRAIELSNEWYRIEEIVMKDPS